MNFGQHLASRSGRVRAHPPGKKAPAAVEQAELDATNICNPPENANGTLPDGRLQLCHGRNWIRLWHQQQKTSLGPGPRSAK